MGDPYKEKLLPLAGFLRPNGGDSAGSDVLQGLDMLGYFLEHWVFTHHTKGVPEARIIFADRFAKGLT